MNAEQLIARYVEYLGVVQERDGVARSPVYVKDKVSRLKRILLVLDAGKLSHVNRESFFKLSEIVMQNFPRGKTTKTGSVVFQYADYLVVLRHLYEMNTGSVAPRYRYYAGALRLPKRNDVKAS